MIHLNVTKLDKDGKPKVKPKGRGCSGDDQIVSIFSTYAGSACSRINRSNTALRCNIYFRTAIFLRKV